MKWFRLHAEIKDDPKMLELDDAQFRVWINLLAMTCEADERGVIPAYRPRGLAAALHTTPEAMEEAFALFAELGMIERRDDGALLVLNFISRQYDNPSDRPEKVSERKNRMKERQQNDTRTPAERQQNDTGTTPERQQNDTGTPAEREKNDTYSDSDSEAEDTQTQKEKEPGNKNYQGAALPPAGGKAGQTDKTPGVSDDAVKIFIDLFTEKLGQPPDIPPRFTKGLKEMLGRVKEPKYRAAVSAFLHDGWASESGYSVETFVGRPIDRWIGARVSGSGGLPAPPPGVSALETASNEREARLAAIQARHQDEAEKRREVLT